ncbi:YitT family protein [Sphingomonas sanxanigenens]|uniref:YitT family protein n=1 Tax=Sphingomonas sanxanigenens DSM 19645 = NX02 TaxID=1123269 RepID=W0A7J8_9SPHN|nr:YitT family protein [Sphingomonas sanxanigenens]AHE53914.1 hypothetical protein NX02_11010 [Sphingomonas sanxanigenens DSM 19645 = NX02]
MQKSVEDARPHSLFEDVYALVVGCVLIVLGLLLLRAAGLTTGGIAGLSLLFSYLLPVPVGLLFALINLPFFLFAGRVMGRRFMIKTVLLNLGIVITAGLAPEVFRLATIAPPVAAFAGGMVIGMGTLSVARHGAGVGGIGVIGLWLQQRHGWNAGRTQILFDAVILGASLTVLSPEAFIWSMLSAAAISGILMAWHRPGRYTGY